MSVTCQCERWKDICDEIRPLYVDHWKEMGLSGSPLRIDDAKYAQMDMEGTLLVVAARDHGKLVGYFLNFLCRHPHYDLLTAAMDVYYLDPKYRCGANGLKLFTEMEKECKKRAVGLMLATARMDRSPGAQSIFRMLGWENTRWVFEKKVN